MEIRVAWTRRSKLIPGQTTDLQGYSPYEFGFNTGERIIANVKSDGLPHCSMWQRVPMSSPANLTQVEVWHEKNSERIFIYAEPDVATKVILP